VDELVREVEKAAEAKGEEVRFGILDGFLNYFDEVSRSRLGGWTCVPA
jgi:hypothetical protein